MMDDVSDKAIDGRTEHTRQALLYAALKLFGKKGYDNTTVRELIAEAGVNLAAINYHFGGKEGLRYAVIDHIACLFREEGPGRALVGLDLDAIADMSPNEARQTLRKIMKTSFARSATRKDIDVKTLYIQRELIQGGKPTELFFEKVFSVQFTVMKALVSRVTGEPIEAEVVRIRAINLIAQSVFLNLARPLVLLALGWDDYSESKMDVIADAFWLHHE